eukprot:1869675-Pyramimonas_sp.AAC.1
MRGATLLPDEEATANEMLEAAETEEHPLDQLTPLEMPTAHYQQRGKVMNLEPLIGELVKASGGRISFSLG